MADTILVAGGKYENREGIYEVVSILGGQVVIRYDTGKQLTTSLEVQTRILDKMARERTAASPKSGKGPTHHRVPKGYGERFEGLKETDFSDDVTGTHWRAREQLGGAVAARIEVADCNFESWSIYKRPQVHWADRRHYAAEPDPDPTAKGQQYTSRVYQGKFLADVKSDSIWFGFYIERTDRPGEPQADWNSFLEWLTEKSGEEYLADVAKRTALDVRVGSDWKARSRRSRLSGVAGLGKHLRGISDSQWVNLLIGVELPKDEAVALGQKLANEIGSLLTTLAPLYDAVARPFLGGKR